MKIVTAEEMRRLEAESARLGIGPAELMENAGRAIAQSVRQSLGGASGKKIVVLVGPGNNGGDGLVAARYLSDRGARVSVYLAATRPEGDRNLRKVRERDIDIIAASSLESSLSSADAALDALFGTGQSRAIGGVFKEALERLAEAKKSSPQLLIFAVDLPSGLNADSGEPDPATPCADHTLTLGLPKRGLYQPAGAARAGMVTILDIGIPPGLTENIATELMTDELIKTLLPARSPFANKGSFGRVRVVAGSENYIGAAYLACAGAARAGAGLVELAAARSLIPIVASRLAEAVYLPLPEEAPGVLSPEASGVLLAAAAPDAMLIGPGLGQREETAAFLEQVLGGLPQTRLALDADALNLISRTAEWWHKLSYDAVITPHPGEMARLAGLTVAEVQADRIELARSKAAAWHKTVVLKGAFTVLAAPDGRCRLSPFASAALASAGTGDVLAGVIAGLLGQGLGLFDAASAGVYLHARAGQRLGGRLGEAGALASDLLPEIPLVIKALKG